MNHARTIFLFNIFIDYDPKVIEQKEQSRPTCLPLSYVLRFVSESTRDVSGSNAVPAPAANITSGQSPAGTSNTTDLKRKLAVKHHTYSVSSSNRSNTPTGNKATQNRSDTFEYYCSMY